jgi:hypothetical protein
VATVVIVVLIEIIMIIVDPEMIMMTTLLGLAILPVTGTMGIGDEAVMIFDLKTNGKSIVIEKRHGIEINILFFNDEDVDETLRWLPLRSQS